MLRPVIRSAATLGILWYFIPTVYFLNWVAVVLASVTLAIAFGLIKPILQVILLPINFVTFGLANLVMVVSLLWLVQYLVPGFSIQPVIVFGIALNHFFTLVFISAVISLISGFLRWLI
ncbi:MAG: phage holin family protein [Patescibacteria group bacterium]